MLQLFSEQSLHLQEIDGERILKNPLRHFRFQCLKRRRNGQRDSPKEFILVEYLKMSESESWLMKYLRSLKAHQGLLWQEIPQSPSNQIQLIDIRPSSPQCITSNQLGKHAANRPNINRGRIRCVADQKFRSAIPSRCHVVCVVLART